VLIVLLVLTLIRWVSEKIKEELMNQHERSNARTCTALTKVIEPITYLAETAWAIGASLVATMVSPLPLLS